MITKSTTYITNLIGYEDVAAGTKAFYFQTCRISLQSRAIHRRDLWIRHRRTPMEAKLVHSPWQISHPPIR